MSKLRRVFPYREVNCKISSKCKANISNEIKKPLPEINLDDYDTEVHSEDELILSENSNSDDEDYDNDNETPSKIMKSNFSPLWVLPLYSMLPAHEQSKVNFIYCSEV